MNVHRSKATRADALRALGLMLLAVGVSLAGAGSAAAAFGITSFNTTYQDATPAHNPVTQAGAHADVVTAFTFSTTNNLPDAELRDVRVDLPAGFYGNPRSAPKCTAAELVQGDGYCKLAAQVGTITYEIVPGFFVDFPVYNMEAAPSQTAVLGAVVASAQIKIVISVRTDGDYGLRATISNINQAVVLTSTKLTLWGVPADPAHDADRYVGFLNSGYPANVPLKPFLSLPTRCEPMTTTTKVDTWQDPGNWVTAESTTPALTGCDRLKFDPGLSAAPQVRSAGEPSAFDVTLNVPQDQSASGLATPTLRTAIVSLPVGTKVSAASAAGLGACSDAALKLGTDEEPSCPDSSKVGTVSITTPVLDDPVMGDVILGTQRPDQLLRLFLVARGPGLLLKIPGKVDPDPVTGRLVATFDNTPQLPFSALQTSFKGGARAALSNPKACGTYTATASLTPWSGGPAVAVDDAFVIDGRCDRSGRFEPVLDAGVLDSTAGGSSSFVLNLSRPNGQQDLSGLDVTLPPGLLAHVGDVPLCPEAQAGAGTCPGTSRVGSVRVGVGAGATPLSVPEPGKAPTAVFLAGPYKGAPFSLSIVVPAQAGPFDLGTVVIRAALFVDPDTAAVTVRSDPLPTILQGIPLDMQTLTVAMDRPGFMISPTNCAPMVVTGQARSADGAAAAVHSAFQATDCASLPYRPRLSMKLTGKGQTTDGKHPALVARLAPMVGDANTKKAKVVLPLALALDPDNANGLCEPTAAAQDKCPATSIVGSAKAVSVLHQPLESPVYFVRGERKDPKTGRIRKTLPKLYIPLKGEGVTVNVRADSDSPDNEHLVTTFDTLPDVPLKSFDLAINGGAHGILVVSSANLCTSNQVATAEFTGHNGREVETDVSVGTPCPLSVRGSGHGASTVRLVVGGLDEGKVAVSGAGIRKQSRTLAGATVATLQPQLTAAAKRRLARGEDVRLRVTATFTAKGTKKVSKTTKTITLHA